MFEKTRQRNQLLDEYCVQLGRNPGDIVRSLLAYPPLDPWASIDAFYDLVGRCQEIGIDEIIVYWPREGASRGDFEHIVAEALPKLRAATEPPAGGSTDTQRRRGRQTR